MPQIACARCTIVLGDKHAFPGVRVPPETQGRCNGTVVRSAKQMRVVVGWWGKDGLPGWWRIGTDVVPLRGLGAGEDAGRRTARVPGTQPGRGKKWGTQPGRGTRGTQPPFTLLYMLLLLTLDTLVCGSDTCTCGGTGSHFLCTPRPFPDDAVSFCGQSLAMCPGFWHS
jgi:hypothetical protein